MKNKLLDFVAQQMCDDYCRFPRCEDVTQDELDKVCDKCPFMLFMELFDNKF